MDYLHFFDRTCSFRAMKLWNKYWDIELRYIITKNVLYTAIQFHSKSTIGILTFEIEW